MPDFVKLNDSFYCVDVVRVAGDPVNVKCILFDMKSLWLQQLSVDSLVEQENKRNPICNYTEGLIQSTLFTEQEAVYSLDPTNLEENHPTLTIKYYVSETPVTFVFTLRPGTTEELSECVIVPLWRTILLLEAKNRALAEQIARKDVEIAQYRAEGAELKRTTVQTTKFEQQLFDESFPIRLPVENGLSVLRLLQKRGQRKTLLNTLQMDHQLDGPEASPSSSDRGATRSLSSKWGVKRTIKKWKHQRVDVLCTKIKFPNLPDNPRNSSSTMAERFQRRDSSDDA